MIPRNLELICVLQFNPRVILALVFDERISLSAVNHTFLYFRPRDK